MQEIVVRSRWKAWAGIAGLLLSLSPVLATTIKSRSFTELVNESEIVVQGKVVGLEVTGTGAARREARSKEHASPRAPGGQAEANGDTATRQEMGVEGGRMLFTRVTLEVEEEIVGQAGRFVELRVAGGSDGQVKVVVHGMPTFEMGQRYIVFLRPGFERAGDPLVGVDQGYFRVLRDAERNQDVLLNAKGDFVLGVERDRIVTRFNADRSQGPSPRLGPPPVPDAGSGARSETSREVARYWSSTEAPMSKEAFRSAIRARRAQP